MSHRHLRPSVLLAVASLAIGGCGGDLFSVEDNGFPKLDGSVDAAQEADAQSDGRIARDADGERGEGEADGAGRIGDARADHRDMGRSSDADVETKDVSASDAREAGRDAGPDQRAEAAGHDASDSAAAADAVAKDAAADGADADDTLEGGSCDVRTTYYRDKDGDGVGATDQHVRACAAPGPEWVVNPGDCRDDLPDVKPNVPGSLDPPVPSGMGYPDPTKPQGISFDYDCSGAEEADPTNAYGTEPDCNVLITNCNGIGYVAATPARTGTGVNPYCGSTMLKSCVVQGVLCGTQTITTVPYRCQ